MVTTLPSKTFLLDFWMKAQEEGSLPILARMSSRRRKRKVISAALVAAHAMLEH